jgi:hypothetical protein
MKISKKNKKLLLDEIQYVSNEMRKCETAHEKMFLFSGIHGMLNRIYNIEYDSTLVFTHFVLSNVHSGFIQKLEALRTGDPIRTVEEDHFDKIEFLINALKENIENDDPVDDTLKKFVELLYSTTGNGYYLKRKGYLKI